GPLPEPPRLPPAAPHPGPEGVPRPRPPARAPLRAAVARAGRPCYGRRAERAAMTPASAELRPPPAARTPPAPDVSVCVVNWNCRDLLRACLASLLHREQGVALEVVVVDNASADGAADLVAREFPEA